MKEYSFYITPEQYIEAEKNGIAKTTLIARVRNYGWDIERAVNEPVRQIIRTEEIKERLKEKGLNSNTFKSRLRRGWSIDKAIETTTDFNFKELNRREAKFLTKQNDKIRIKNGIGRSTFYARVRSGWSIERALNTPTMTRKEVADSSYMKKLIDARL